MKIQLQGRKHVGKRFVSNNLYESEDVLYDTLYDDGTWKLYVPKCAKGVVELASHMESFYGGWGYGYYTEARWIAKKDSTYEKYTEEGNKIYIIQYWEDGKYKEAWQIVFDAAGDIYFSDKNGDELSGILKKRAPKKLLDKIICDNENSIFKDLSLLDIWRLIPRGKKIYDMYDGCITFSDLFEMYPEKYLKVGDRLWLTKDGKSVVYIDTHNLPQHSVLEFPESVENFASMQPFHTYLDELVCRFETVHVPKKLVDTLNNGKTFRFISRDDRLWKTKNLIFDEGIETIPNYFVAGVESIENVTFPSTLTKIGESAFQGCTGLTHVDLPVGLKTISKKAFESCESLITLDIPDSVTKIDYQAFANCENLVSVKLPAKLASKGSEIFYGCVELTDVVNMQVLAGGIGSFDECPNLDTSSLESI